VSRELNAIATRESHELERAGADRGFTAVEIFARGAGGGAFRYQQHVREVLEKRPVGRSGFEPQCMAVDDLLRRDRPHVGRESAGASLDRDRALE
jgi:hypothetical protein